ncbi:DUF2683 family protein [archaeon]|nr:DUF2683 family protein [archaeon]
MVQALVTLNEHENRILNIVKGKFGLHNKSEALVHIIDEYEEELLEPELKPEFVKKMLKRQAEPAVRVSDFRKHFGLK